MRSESTPTGGKVSQAQMARFHALLHRPENRTCFDCGTRQPRWASTNLGVFFCLRCAGIHRSMGVHISKVKSTNMDSWEESMMNLIEHVGNERGRVLYEYNMPDGAKARNGMSASDVERLLRNKYERKMYYNPNFDALYLQFMATPLEADPSLQCATTTNGALGNAPVTLTRPTRAEPSAPPKHHAPAPVMEELWGGPVEASAPVQQQRQQDGGASRLAVAELFSSASPPGSRASPNGPTPVWGMGMSVSMTNAYSPNTSYPAWGAMPLPVQTQQQQQQQQRLQQQQQQSMFSRSIANYSSTGPPAGTMGQLGRADSTSAWNSSSVTRSNTEDLFASSPVTRTTGARAEILSLFSSAPVAGASASTSLPPNAAWQPHVVRPYYFPEK